MVANRPIFLKSADGRIIGIGTLLERSEFNGLLNLLEHIFRWQTFGMILENLDDLSDKLPAPLGGDFSHGITPFVLLYVASSQDHARSGGIIRGRMPRRRRSTPIPVRTSARGSRQTPLVCSMQNKVACPLFFSILYLFIMLKPQIKKLFQTEKCNLPLLLRSGLRFRFPSKPTRRNQQANILISQHSHK